MFLGAKVQWHIKELIKNVIVEPGVVVHAYNPSTLGGRDRRIWVRGQPQLSLSLLSEALRNFVRPGFKIKYKK